MVQFGSSLLREPGANGGEDELIVGYGAQDTVPLVVSLPVKQAIAMLEVLPE